MVQTLQFIRIAFRNLAARQARTLLMGSAIVFVTTLLMLLLSLSSGIQKVILRNATALASGHVNVGGFFKLSQTSATPVVTDYKKYLTLISEEFPEVLHVYDRQKGFGKLISDTTSLTLPMWGVTYENEKFNLDPLMRAKHADYIEGGDDAVEGNIAELAKRGTVVIFASQAKKLNVRVGDSLTVSLPTYRNVYNTKDLKVVAVLADLGLMSSFATFLNDQDLRELYQMSPTATGQIMLVLKDPALVSLVEERLRERVKAMQVSLMDKESQPYWMKFDRVSAESWVGQKIDVTTWQDETAYIKWVLDIINALTFVFVSILLVIIVLGLMNTLWMSIRERTPEVGTLRAIGLQSRQVLLLFFLEALLLSFGSILIGTVVGALLVNFVNWLAVPVTSEAFQLFVMSNRLELWVGTKDLFIVFGMVGLFLVLGSLWPAYRASKLKPVAALSHVG